MKEREEYENEKKTHTQYYFSLFGRIRKTLWDC